jgi:ABC-type uncharacterized transport system ATPase subunit
VEEDGSRPNYDTVSIIEILEKSSNDYISVKTLHTSINKIYNNDEPRVSNTLPIVSQCKTEGKLDERLLHHQKQHLEYVKVPDEPKLTFIEQKQTP